MSLHTLQEIHKINDKISGTRHDNFLNMFPSKNGITNDLSPSTIILGSPNQYYNKLKIKLGEYAQVYIGTVNRTKQITVGAIALRTTNESGEYCFMSLAMRKNFTLLYEHKYQ